MKISKENIKFAKQVVKNLKKALKENITYDEFNEITGLNTCLGKFCVTTRTDKNDPLSYDCRACIFSYGNQKDPKGVYCYSLLATPKTVKRDAQKVFDRLNKLISQYYKEIPNETAR